MEFSPICLSVALQRLRFDTDRLGDDGPLAKAAVCICQPQDQWGDVPEKAIARVEYGELFSNLLNSQLISIMKRSATETWKSITVNQYEIDVRSRTGNSFIEYIRRLIYQRQHQSLKHCLVGKLAARDAVASRLSFD
ncbi:MAG TPA: hypothetical protein DCG64_06090 [Alphaproteobacteria bacterium]|nr:hypothetical protein [Alphaproteobacteria bacterium]